MNDESPIFCIDESNVTTRMLTADAFLVYSVTAPGLLAVPVDLLVFCAVVGDLSHYGHSGVPRTDGHTVDLHRCLCPHHRGSGWCHYPVGGHSRQPPSR
jgi:hypothetical protein